MWGDTASIKIIWIYNWCYVWQNLLTETKNLHKLNLKHMEIKLVMLGTKLLNSNFEYNLWNRIILGIIQVSPCQ